MSAHPVATKRPGEVVLLMGNEAIARGAIEGGISLAAAYPGTPSSEIGNTLARVAKEVDIHFEWSGNEKVAFEVAYGASMCYQRALVSMKHVGVNVALDILNPVARAQQVAGKAQRCPSSGAVHPPGGQGLYEVCPGAVGGSQALGYDPDGHPAEPYEERC